MELEYSIENKKRNRFYSIAIIIGLISIVWEIFIYRITFIELKTLLILIFGIGLIATLIDYKAYKETYSYRGFNSFFFAMLTNICIWGFTTCTLFMTTNYYLRDDNSTLIKFKIENKSTKNGHHMEQQPVYTITHNKLDKNILFNDTYFEQRNLFEFIELEIHNGFWGYDIYSKKRLLE